MPNLLMRLKIKEVSSVDRGAGHGVNVVMMKRDLGTEPEPYWKRNFSDKQRSQMADAGTALPDGSYPIANESDLHNAIRAIGRAKDPEKAKAHIKARAEAMGMKDAIPNTWEKRDDASHALAAIMAKACELGADDAKVKAAAKAMAIALGNIEKNLDGDAQLAAVEKSLSQCVEHLAGLVPTDKRDDFLAASAAIPTVKGDSTMTEAEKAEAERKRKEADDKEKKEKADLLTKVAKMAREISVLKMSDDHKAHMATLDSEDAKDKFADMTPAQRDEEMGKKKAAKALDPTAVSESPVVKALQTESADLKKRLSEFEKRDEVAAFAKRATDLGLPEEHGEVMRKAYGGDKEAIAKHEQLIKSLRTQVDTGALFKEFGSSSTTVPTDAYAQIRAKAEELRKTEAGAKLSMHQAVNKVMSDPANAELVAKNRHERLQKMGAVAA